MRTARRWAVVVIVAVLGVVVGAQPASAFVAVGYTSVFGRLNVRTGPSTSYPIVWTVANGVPVRVVCQTTGMPVAGTMRTTAIWDRLDSGRYVTDAYIAWPGGRPWLPWCNLSAPGRTAALLNMRANASTLDARAGTLPPNTVVTVTCQLDGEWIAGSARATSTWDRLSNGLFVSDAYVVWPGARPAIPWCVLTAAIAPAAGTPFISWAAGYARQSMRLYHVPASVTLAQAILESGWGKSALTLDGNSYFGMKCFGSPGPIATGCRPYRTTECGNGGCYGTTATFRVYTTVWASFKDHGNQLASLSRYRPAFGYVHSPDLFAVQLQRGGYATSPTYAQNLIALMRQYNLYQYDVGLV